MPCGGGCRLQGVREGGFRSIFPSIRERRSGAAAPGEEAVVLEAGFAIGERGAGEGLDAAPGRFENGLPGGGVPLHRCAKARVEVALAGRDDAEFERAAAAL